ncbi:epoxyqueuosine reductase QueH [candidate division WOR-3 bacterium]|uniref:Epoxyqueuosine reductase QueH n=1 Tax=candidate division WOR-3 bacterium TaxID=2052148 RepID=A0A937XCT6_UNCW3|nr:epoxyqueuosine reductase QueH [candidate division WOR-3 bacterium]
MKPKLLLHICCGPCSTEVIRRLKDDYEVVGFFYNPNVHPEAEYNKRLMGVQRISALWRVLVDVGHYDRGRFIEAVRGLEAEPEGGRRCSACYRLRLEETARRAAENGCTHLATTLTIAPMKKAAVINPIGKEVATRHGLTFVDEDWKKRDGFRQSIELSRDLGLYRQNYCGCGFSRR